MKRIIILITTIVFILMLTGCGLERPLITFTPVDFVETADGRFIFKTKADHADVFGSVDFLGYEVYYKFALDPSEFENYNDLVDPGQLNQAGFRRLHSSVDTISNPEPLPLIKTDDSFEGDLYNVTISLANLDMTEPTITADGTASSINYQIRRSVPDTTSIQNADHYRKFSEFWSADLDTDVNPDLFDFGGLPVSKGDLIPTPVYMAIYVYAYGKNIDFSIGPRDIVSPLQYFPPIQIKVVYDDGE